MRRDEIVIPDPPPNDRPSSRWMCGREGSESPCPHGPSGSGTCLLAEACTPKRTWYGKRKRIATAMLAVATIVTFLFIRTKYAADVFKPGGLATPHAQILSGTATTNRCAACHPPAALSPNTWFDADSDGHRAEGGRAAVTQTDRCLDCHHNVIRRDRATLAHNVPESVLAQIRSRIHGAQIRLASTGSIKKTWHDAMPGPSIDQSNVQCSACHREHQGAVGTLLDVADSQCQTCHVDRFGSFADSHPDWSQWPYGRGGSIAFNHQTHATKHYPGSQHSGAPMVFDCASCHRADAKGELARSPSYELACQSCHDAGLKIEAAEGIELLALPTLPKAEGAQKWPEQARGFYDGKSRLSQNFFCEGTIRPQTQFTRFRKVTLRRSMKMT